MSALEVQKNPIINLKTGVSKLQQHGMATLLQLLFLAVVFYGLYQLLFMVIAGTYISEFEATISGLQTDTNNSELIKDAVIELAKKTGLIIGFSTILISLLSIVYTIATTRVYVNTVRSKNTKLSDSIRFGFDRLGVSFLFYLYVSAIVFAYVIAMSILGAIGPVSLIVSIPLGIFLLVVLVIRLLFSTEVLADDKKPKVTEVFKISKELTDNNSTPIVLYLLFGAVVFLLTSWFVSTVLGAIGLRPSESYSQLTNSRDILYTTINFAFTSIVSIFLSVGWVEIYNQAKATTKTAAINQKPKKK